MNTLVISNKGLIEANDLCLIGSSTKRGDNTKIGMFGSGWKYALAWLLRNDISIRIFSGEEEIKVSVDLIIHRNTPTRVLTVNNERTSVTTEMGPDWSGWMAIREIVSNAIDEGNEVVTTQFNCKPEGLEGVTRVFIEMNKELDTIIRNYSDYFCFDKKEDCSNKRGRVFIKETPGVPNYYRKGIKCYDFRQLGDSRDASLLDFDFNNISINESRVSEYYDIKRSKRSLLHEGVSEEVLVCALKETTEWSAPSDDNLEKLNSLSKKGYKFLSKLDVIISGLKKTSEDHFDNDKKTIIILNDAWYRAAVSAGIIDKKFDGDDEFIYHETDSINVALVQDKFNKIGLTNLVVKCGIYDDNFSNIVNNNNTVIIRDDHYLKNDIPRLCTAVLNALPSSKIIPIFE